MKGPFGSRGVWGGGMHNTQCMLCVRACVCSSQACSLALEAVLVVRVCHDCHGIGRQVLQRERLRRGRLVQLSIAHQPAS